MIPDYPATGKRTLQDNGSWLHALKRPNVELVREGIDHIDAHGIVTVSGARYDVDIIVYATGFQANRFLWPMRHRRSRRRGALGAVGRRAVGVPRHHGPELPEPVLHVRTRARTSRTAAA